MNLHPHERAYMAVVESTIHIARGLGLTLEEFLIGQNTTAPAKISDRARAFALGLAVLRWFELDDKDQAKGMQQ